SYLFKRKGLFLVKAAGTDEDTLLTIALDAGAEDMKRESVNFEITCEPSAFNKVQEVLQKNSIVADVAEITQLAITPVDADLETAQKVARLIETLDDHDDVQNVYTNMHMT